jgi:hypothetical protein
MFVHEAVIALRMLPWNADVFILFMMLSVLFAGPGMIPS